MTFHFDMRGRRRVSEQHPFLRRQFTFNKWEFRARETKRKRRGQTVKRNSCGVAGLLGRSRALFNMQRRMHLQRQREWYASIPMSCREHIHNWDDEQEYCLDCGTSVWRWAFCEAP